MFTPPDPRRGTQTPASAAPDAGADSRDEVHMSRILLRWSRFIMATLTSTALCVLMVTLYFLGMIPGDLALRASAVIQGFVLLFYLLFR